MMMRKTIVCLAVALLTAACGNNGTGPSQIPDVAGSYSGTTSFSFPDLGVSGSCPTSTTVTQNGATLNIAPIVLGGQCGNQSIPVGQTTIDGIGSLTVQASGTTTNPSCGVYTYNISGGFSGKELRISTVLKSSSCPNMSMTISLTRS